MDLNPVHPTSTMKIRFPILKARLRCTIKLLLLLIHCVGFSHGMPHVLRFGEPLLFSLLSKSLTAMFSPHKLCCPVPTCWRLTFPHYSYWEIAEASVLSVFCSVTRNLAFRSCIKRVGMDQLQRAIKKINEN